MSTPTESGTAEEPSTPSKAGALRKAGAPYEPSVGLWHSLAGAALFVLGGLMVANMDNTLRALGLAAIAGSFYLLLAGGVARGMQLARISR